MRAPTGEQFTIRHDGGEHAYEATITEVAATLRTLTIDGVDLVQPFDADQRPAKGQGIVLAPWPGRVKGARWSADGAEQQLAITEPKTGNAIHGLLRYSPYRVARQTSSSVQLAATIYPQLGYPYVVDTSVTYTLTDRGLEVVHEATNVGTEPAPWACGVHPYLAVGEVPAEQLTLTVPAATVFETDELKIPIAEVPVGAPGAAGTDLRAGARLAELDLDTGFGSVSHVGGRATSTLAAADGRTSAIWQDEAFGYVVVFTPRDFPQAGVLKHVAAVEPMSAPANALNSGDGVVWLAPSESWRGRWGIEGHGF